MHILCGRHGNCGCAGCRCSIVADVKEEEIGTGIIAVLPIAMQALTGLTALSLGGTALLIAVSVVLDLVRKIEAQVSMREY